ncbi:MAG: glycosyltransferase family 4 protein [Myxococcales bacterium]
MRIAYLHYGERSGVRESLCPELRALGHQVVELQATGPLEWRSEGRLRVTPRVLLHLCATIRYGRRALQHRWNTPYAFDVHSRRAEALLGRLSARPDIVLQHGALFSPALPPFRPYALLLDHTRRAAMEQPPQAEAGLPAPVDYGSGWSARELELYRGAAVLCSHSRRVAGSLERHYGIEPSKVRVVGGAANVFPDRPVREHDGRTITFVGREFARKGGLVLTRAFTQLRRRRPEARLLVVGPKERLDLPAGAVRIGPVPFGELPAIFAASTVFALPSLQEPFGLAFLDAMACGLPCVGTSIEAVPEIVEHGETGLLVPPGDELSLAAALERLLADPALARRMGERGRERVRDRHRWTHVARAIDGALADALADALKSG